MLLGVGGFATGALGDPGPGVALPGGQGFTTVAEVPAGCEDVPAVVEVEPMPLLVDEVVLVEGVPVVALVLPAVVVLPEPMLPLFDGVHGAVVAEVPDPVVEGIPVWPVVVPWLCVPSVPPVVLPALPATPGAPELMVGDPVEVAPGAVVVLVVPLWPTVPVVPVVVPVVPVVPVVVPGWEVVLGVPMPGLGVADPVVWAPATPRASANTDDANKIFRIEACSLSELLRPMYCAAEKIQNAPCLSGMPSKPA
jgi:hypothetical protein